MFEYTKQPKNLTQYTLMQGVTDFGNLAQFNQFETGYSFLKVIQIPKFLEVLAGKDTKTLGPLIQNYKHVLEYEFRGLDGIDDISADTLEITNGISNLNMISKVNEQSGSQVSMRYFEKSGSLFTKVHTMFLKGLKDPKTQAKTYLGLIDSGELEAGYENEVFIFLYFVTDNTMTQVEKSYLLLSAQPNKAETSIYNSEKGDIANKEITAEFNCYPVQGDSIDQKAKEILDWMNSPVNPNRIIKQSSNYQWTGLDKVDGIIKSQQ